MSLREIERDSVGAIIRSLDDQIIMGTKIPGTAGAYAGAPDEVDPFWVLPGGIRNENQTHEEAVIAEILEEAGLDFSDYPLNEIDNLGSDIAEVTLSTGEKIVLIMKFSIYGFSIALPAREVELACGDEMSRMEWVKISRLNEYRLCPPSKALCERHGYLPTERLTEIPIKSLVSSILPVIAPSAPISDPAYL